MVYELLNSSAVSIETKVYMNSRYMSCSDVSEHLLHEFDIKSSSSNVASKIYYDKGRIISELGIEFLSDLSDKSEDMSSKYADKLIGMLEKYNRMSYECAVGIDIRNNDKVSFNCSNEKFEEFKSVIKPYTFKIMQIVEDSIDKGTAAYVRYLLHSNVLIAEDAKRAEELKRFILGEDIL